MGAEPLSVDDLLGAVLDGTPVDWAEVEARGSAAVRDLVPYLRIVSGVARAHAEVEPSSVTDPLAAPPVAQGSWGGLNVLERVGQGSFGEVYRAWDPRLARDVALKLLRPGRGLPSAEESAAIEEGRLLARVRHPNVVTVHGADRVDGRVGIWMELLRGPTLADLVRSDGPFGAEEAARIGVDLCGALAAVHEAGLLHRDIKAKNVILERDGRVVLMDFGAGHEEGRGGPAAGRAGTPLYLAPEIVAGRPATPQSDIYSLGVLLYHLVSGRYPVTGESQADLYDAHARGARTPLLQARPDVPPRFAMEVERAIAPEPAARHRTARDFARGLQECLAPPAHRGWRAFTAAALALAIGGAVVGAMVTPAARRDFGLGGGGSIGSAPAAVAPDGSEVVLRKVPLPLGMLLGRPSPDGRVFSYSDKDGNLALFDLATARSRRLTDHAPDSDAHALYSTVSTDARAVAYTWWADHGYEMRVIGSDGGEPRVLLRRSDIESPRPLEWSRDGRRILCILSRRDGTNVLALVDLEGASVHPVTELGTTVPRNASLSPDGAWVAFDAPPAGSSRSRDLYVVRAEGGTPRALLSHPANDVAPIWSPDGRQLLFASDRSGALDVWRVPMAGAEAAGDPELVHRNVGRMFLLGLTDQGRYYVQLLVGTVEVYAADLTGEGTVGRPVPLGPTYAGSNISSVWSPDGRFVAYASRRGLVGFDRGDTTLVIRDVATGDQRELIPPMVGFLVRSWSPDGRRVVVHGNDITNRMGLHVIDVSSGAVTPLALAGAGGRIAWLPGRDQILYARPDSRVVVSRDITTMTEQVVLDLREEGIEVLAGGLMGPGYDPSPDGRAIAFVGVVGKGAQEALSLRIKAGDGPSRELLRVEPPSRLALQDWMPDGRSLLVTRASGRDPWTLWRVPVDGGEAQPLGLTLKGLRDVGVHPDGRRITFTAGWPALEVWVIENVLER